MERNRGANHCPIFLPCHDRRGATYDNQIRRWLKEDVVKGELSDEDADMKDFARTLLKK